MVKKQEVGKTKEDLTLKSFEKDKAELEQKIQTLREQVNNAQVQLCRFDGALGYINDNIKKLKEVEDAR